jgi:hypothetical protein
VIGRVGGEGVQLSTSPGPAPANNEMNRTNRGVPGMKERRPSGEPVLAEVGPPIILSLDVAGYFSVIRTLSRRLGSRIRPAMTVASRLPRLPG